MNENDDFGPDFDLSNDQYRAMKNVMLIDVRETEEWNAGHIPGAIHVPLSELAVGKELECDRDTVCVLYCCAGVRSKTAATILAGRGYTHLHHLSKGSYGWDGEFVRD